MRKPWTDIEMVLTLGYYKFNENPHSKKELKKFSEMIYKMTGIERSPDSYGFRVSNYMSADPNTTSKGLSQGGKRVYEFWDEYVTKDPSLSKLKSIYNSFIEEYYDFLNSENSKYSDLENKNLIRRISEVHIYNRSTKVKNATLKRAGGYCELWKKYAPFKTKQNEPYLEVHHVIELSKDGKDSTDNTVALCPNCHMRIHYGKELTKEEQEILNKVLTKTF